MPMTLQEFGEHWLKEHRMLSTSEIQDDGSIEYIDTKYDEAVGKAALEVLAVISKQGHSGTSASILWTVLQAIFTAYTDPRSKIWHDFFLSAEGIKLQEEFAGHQFIYPDATEKDTV